MIKKLVAGAVLVIVPVLGASAPASADVPAATTVKVKVVKDLPRDSGIVSPQRAIDWH